MQPIAQFSVWNDRIHKGESHCSRYAYFSQEQWETDIENIIVKDNGVGFNKQNFESFDTYATDFIRKPEIFRK